MARGTRVCKCHGSARAAEVRRGHPRSLGRTLSISAEVRDKSPLPSHFYTLREGRGGGGGASLFFPPPFLPLRFITSVSPNLG